MVAHFHGCLELHLPIWKSRCSTPDIQVQSDASGSWGCGALTKDKWLSFPWPDPLQELSIAHKSK